MSEIDRLKKELKEIEQELTALKKDSRAYKALMQEKSDLEARLVGSGAIAKDGSTGVGKKGVNVEGSVGGDVLTGVKAENVFSQKEIDKSLTFPEALERYLNSIIAIHQHLRLLGIRAGSQPLSVSLEKVYAQFYYQVTAKKKSA